MKNSTRIFFILMVSAYSVAYATGEHAGGHGADGHDDKSAHWMAPVAEAEKKNPIEANDESIKQGAKLYQLNCASCHGENADGTGVAGSMLEPKPTNLRVMSGNHPDGDFAFKIREGRGAMPSWKGQFDDTSIWHLVNFIQALKEESSQDMKKEHGHADGHKHDADS